MSYLTRFHFIWKGEIKYLDRIGKWRWEIAGIPCFAGKVFIESKSTQFTFRSTDRSVSITPSEIIDKFTFKIRGAEPIHCQVYKSESQLSPRLMQRIQVTPPDYKVEEYIRVSQNEWRRVDNDTNVPSLVILDGDFVETDSTFNTMTLQGRDGLSLNFEFYRLSMTRSDENPLERHAQISAHSEAPTPCTVTSFKLPIKSGKEGTFEQFDKVGPIDWLRSVDGTLQPGILHPITMNGNMLVLEDEQGQKFELARGQIEWFPETTMELTETSDEPCAWQYDAKITSRSNLAEDPMHRSSAGVAPISPLNTNGPIVYRTTVHLPLTVRSVEVWTSESAALDIDGRHFSTDADRSQVVVPLRPGRLNISMPATGLHAPAIYLRTNTMRPSDRPHVIHPDVELHKKLASMEDGKLRDLKRSGHLPATMSDQEADALQSVLQSLGRAVQYTHNETATGWHHDRFVSPPNMLAPHMEITFHGDGAASGMSARALSNDEAGQALSRLRNSASFVSHDVLFGQSFSDFWEMIKHAGTIVVHTVTKIGGQIIDTARHVIKDIGEVIDEAGEHLVRGDIVGAGKDVLTGGEHIAKHLGTGLSDIVNTGYKGAEQVLVITAGFIGEEAHRAYEFVIHNTGILGDGLNWLVTKAGGELGKFLRGFLDEFGWENIVHTQAAIAHGLLKGLDGLIDSADGVAAASKEAFSDVVKANDKAFDSAIAAVTAHVLPKQIEPDTNMSAAMDALEWILGKFAFHLPGSSPIPLPSLPGHAAGPMDEISAFMTDNFGSESDVQKRLFHQAFTELGEGFLDLQHAPEHLFAAMLDIVRGAVDLGLDLVSRLVDLAVTVMKAALKAFRTLITTEIKFPIIEEFFTELSGKPLTLLNLTTLIVAVPVTIISELVVGRVPFAATRVGQQASDKSVEDWALTYGGTHIVLSLLSSTEIFGMAAGKGADRIFSHLTGLPTSAKPDVGSMSPSTGVVRTLNALVNFCAQFSGNPITPGNDYRCPPNNEAWNPLLRPNYMSHVIWNYQWFGFAFTLVGSGAISGAEAGGVRIDRINIGTSALAGATTLYGAIHVLFMGFLHQADLTKHDFIEGLMDGKGGHGQIDFVALNLKASDDIRPKAPDNSDTEYSAIMANFAARRGAVNAIKDAAIAATVKKAGNASDAKATMLFTENLVDWRRSDATDTVTTAEWLQSLAVYHDFAHSRDAGTGLQNKLTANLMDCIPEVFASLAIPELVEYTEGGSLAGLVTANLLGHMTEGSIHIDRYKRGQLL